MKLPVGFANGVVHQATAFGGLGQKLLEKHGWEKGDGLGKERKGISKAIEVQKKEDQLGVGAELKPSWDWSKNFWADAFDSAVSKVQGHDEDSDDSSDDSSDEDEEPVKKKKKGTELSATNRDGTLASASASELKLAAELAKDPWGRWGGRGGKMARIREHEAAEAKEKGEKLGLGTSERQGHPSTSAPSEKRWKGKAESDIDGKVDASEARKPRIVIVVSIKDDPKKERLRAKFKQTPKTGWWGAAYFMSAGAMEGMDEEDNDKEASKEDRREGFKEADQEALYMMCHDHQRVGKRGLGKSTHLKIEGGNWEGTKMVFSEAEAEPLKNMVKKDDDDSQQSNGKKAVIKLAKRLLKDALKQRMKIGKLFKLISQSIPDETSIKAVKKLVKKGKCEELGYEEEHKWVTKL